MLSKQEFDPVMSYNKKDQYIVNVFPYVLCQVWESDLTQPTLACSSAVLLRTGGETSLMYFEAKDLGYVLELDI